MKVIKLKFLDGATFTAEASNFSTIHFPAHEHGDTKLIMPEMVKLSVMGRQVFIGLKSGLEFDQFLASSLSTLLEINEVSEPEEHILAGYATVEEFEKAKQDLIEAQQRMSIEREAFLEEAKRVRKANKKSARLKKAKKKK